jgi:hypothetical protein
MVNGSSNAAGGINGGGSARASDEASAPFAPAENLQQYLNGPTLIDFPQSGPLLEDREGLRRVREREAERRSRNLQAAQEFLDQPDLREMMEDPIPVARLNRRVYAKDPVPMDEDEVNHLNNPPVEERALSPGIRVNMRRREPTEAVYLNPRESGE